MSQIIEDLSRNGIAFISGKDRYSYMAHCLADGLSQIGVPVLANRNFADSKVCDFQFTANELPELQRSALKIVDLWGEHFNQQQIFRYDADPKDTWLLSNADEATTQVIGGEFNFICAHENRFMQIEGNRIPWAFGLSSRMIEHVETLNPQFENRKQSFVCNFRPSLNQSLRESLDLSFLPHLEKAYPVDRSIVGASRWNLDYYRHLSENLGCLAYGGVFMQDPMLNEHLRNIPELNAVFSHFAFSRSTVVTRWDSWRFWESLLMGCLTLQLNFEKYGFLLPEMPAEGEHYIGIDLEDTQGTVERIQALGDRCRDIMQTGQNWALKNYSPRATAQRFLRLLAQ